MIGKIRPLAALAALMAAWPAGAADWSGEAGFVSDYRDRGVSQSDEEIAFQAALDVDLTPAWRVSAWASSLTDNARGDAEINLGASYAGVFGLQGFWAGGVQGVFYPGGAIDGNHVEVYGNVGLDYGLLVPSLGVTYAPSNNDGTGGNVYTQARLDGYWPGKPFGAALSVGFEHLERAGDKWDWSVGLFHTAGPATLTLRYVDTDQAGRFSDAALVFEAKIGF